MNQLFCYGTLQVQNRSISEKVGVLKKIKLVDAAIVAASILAAAGFWTRNIVLIALIIPAGIVLVTSKATTREERERRESLSLKSFAFSLFIPIIIIFAMVIYFIGRLVPMIIESWQ
jgi:heme O synthase-like polyprenyltransferase